MLSLDLSETGCGNYTSICLPKKGPEEFESQKYLSYTLRKSSQGEEEAKVYFTEKKVK